VEYTTDCAVPLVLIPTAYVHPLAQQFEEISEEGELIRSYDEWGLASVLTYAYTRKVAAKADYSTMEEIMGACLEESRHTRSENKDLFRMIKRGIKSGNEEAVYSYTRTLISRLGTALAEQHEAYSDDDEDDDDD
jgi:flagellar biosynthesis protein FlhB